METAQLLRLLLIMVSAAMLLLAIAYLRQRNLSPMAFIGWGLLAVFIPILGPFLVILSRPGAAHPRRTIRRPLRVEIQ